MTVPIRKIGPPLAKDDEGFFRNECSFDKLQTRWKPAVELTVAQYLRRDPGNVVSIYLRGSLPLGLAVEGVSDIDTIAIVRQASDDFGRLDYVDFKKALLAKFPFVRDVEMQQVPLDRLMNLLTFMGLRFVLKHLSLKLYGEDLAARIPSFKPSLKLAYAMHGYLSEEIRETRHHLSLSLHPRQVQAGCAWIMKRMLRTGSAMKMDLEGEFTRDLVGCYEIFSKHYPDKELEMRKTLEWAVEPIADPSPICSHLESFGAWLAAEAERIFRVNRV